jgi:hypothetical protein
VATGIAGLGSAGVLTSIDQRRAEAALQPVSMAMHVHSSFSEGTGSMLWQLAQAAASGVDVVWWSDHDWRMSGYGYRRAIHFDGFTELEDGASLTWKVAKAVR